jgi:hypothetical protein
MMAGSVHLDSLAAWTSMTDHHRHSVTGALGFTMIGLSLMAPLVLRRVPRLLVVLIAAGVLLALGPFIQLSGGGLNIPGPISVLAWLGPSASFFNFPCRMLWVGHLGLGILAAMVATRLSEKLGPARDRRWCRPLIAMAALDILLVTGTPLRTQAVPYDVPSAYDKAPEDRAILELWPEFGSFGTDLALLTNNLGCAHQARHGRPLANQCLGTTVGAGTRSIGRWMNTVVFDLDRALVREVPRSLGKMGFGAVVVRPDLYGPDDRRAMLGVLTQALGEPIAESTDAGEHLVVFEVPRTQTDPATQQQTYAQIRAAYP